MTEIKWTTRTILISVPDNPAWAKAGFVWADQVWNEAQSWFGASYEPAHPNVYYILEVAQSGQSAQVTVQYVTQLPNGDSAETTGYGTRIDVVLAYFAPSHDASLVALHELGHVLGLADNSVSHDLMTMVSHVGNYPSTLDLYAAYVQAVSRNAYRDGDALTLPPSIPYMTWNPNLVVPEFPNALVILIATLIIGALVTYRRRV